MDCRGIGPRYRDILTTELWRIKFMMICELRHSDEDNCEMATFRDDKKLISTAKLVVV